MKKIKKSEPADVSVSTDVVFLSKALRWEIANGSPARVVEALKAELLKAEAES